MRHRKAEMRRQDYGAVAGCLAVLFLDGLDVAASSSQPWAARR
jgi:hypothetical protein